MWYIFLSMIGRFTGSRGLAAFVLAFLCLNVGGALCLSYCGQLAMAHTATSDDSHLSEHCRQAKKAAEEANDSDSFDANAASCCMLPVSLFAAPLEKQTRLAKVVVANTVPVPNFEFSPPVIASDQNVAMPVYRPPPLDRRVERLLNCVIRI